MQIRFVGFKANGEYENEIHSSDRDFEIKAEKPREMFEEYARPIQIPEEFVERLGDLYGLDHDYAEKKASVISDCRNWLEKEIKSELKRLHLAYAVVAVDGVIDAKGRFVNGPMGLLEHPMMVIAD